MGSKVPIDIIGIPFRLGEINRNPAFARNMKLTPAVITSSLVFTIDRIVFAPHADLESGRDATGKAEGVEIGVKICAVAHAHITGMGDVSSTPSGMALVVGHILEHVVKKGTRYLSHRLLAGGENFGFSFHYWCHIAQ